MIFSAKNSIYIAPFRAIKLNFKFSHKPVDICHHLWPQSHFLQLELLILFFALTLCLYSHFYSKSRQYPNRQFNWSDIHFPFGTDGGGRSREPEIIDGGGTSPEGEFGYGHLNNGPREMVAPPKMQRNRFC